MAVVAVIFTCLAFVITGVSTYRESDGYPEHEGYLGFTAGFDFVAMFVTALALEPDPTPPTPGSLAAFFWHVLWFFVKPVLLEAPILAVGGLLGWAVAKLTPGRAPPARRRPMFPK